MRIIKRKKGNKKYFYLQHSFRKGKKVITKEKYLGNIIPKNIDDIKIKFKKESQKDLYKRLENIKNKFQKEWKRVPRTVKQSEKEEIAIAFTYNTNAIEGSTITLAEAREIIRDNISPNKPLNDVKETEAHFRVFLEMLIEKEKISSKVLLKWHKKIFKDTKPYIAGKYRNYLVRVGSHVAPDWKNVKKLMRKLITFVNKRINPVELSARTHYRFEKIHPFGDGNGRIGRLLMNYILWHSKYPMLMVEYKRRDSYYNAISGDEEKFVKYFIRKYLKVHKRKI